MEELPGMPVRPPVEKLSADVRRTQKNRALLATGRHPATLAKLLGGDYTCGQCIHHERVHWHDKIFHKCELHHLRMSHSAASDIRISWPACICFETEDELPQNTL